MLLVAGALALSTLGFVVLRRFEPTADSLYPKCLFYQWTGLHCPGCGATRALRALSLGDVRLAIRTNPMLIIGGPIIALLVWIQKRRERRGLIASPRLAWCLFVVLMTYFILRNVPTPATGWLAPPV
ncbi:MAG: DUF2752 domain-containing protein [Planctomycetota bacterium]